MNQIFQALRPFIRWVVTHAYAVVAVSVALSIVSVFLASNLRIDTDFSKLVPEDYESVKALERLRETVGAESEMAIGIVSPSFEANRQFAEALIPQALDMVDERSGERFLSRVDYRRDTEFLENNALYFATSSELDSLQAFLEERIEEAKLEANPFFFDLEEEDEEPDSSGAHLKGLYDDVIGTEYPISEDSTTMVLRFFPTGSQTNIGYIERLYDAVGNLVERLDPEGYHPEMEVTIAGRLQRQVVEIRAVTNDIVSTLGLGITIVLLTVVAYFSYKAYMARTSGALSLPVLLSVAARVPVMALIIGLPLSMSLTWTAAIAWLTVETLNLMTATLGLVLFGLGIDYGIHFYARYTEERARRHPPIDAVEHTFFSTGQAITVGALTTAAALFVLIVADFRGFSEFGFIAGTGILLSLASMLVVMPAMIVILERWHLLKLEGAPETDGRYRRDGRIRLARPIIVVSSLAVLASLVMFPPKFEYRFGELEPEFTEYQERNAVIRRVYSDRSRRNPAYIVADRPEDV
ncbi:MAG: MMPL family transporter, partial [Rhodothermales bacterium]|nr:MMPL family transporter [Rhodothermales bacterium]